MRTTTQISGEISQQIAMIVLLALLTVLVTQSAAQDISVSAKPSTTSIEVTWSISGDDDVGAVEIHYKCLLICDSTCNIIYPDVMTAMNTGTLTISGLEGYATYNITVKVGDAANSINVTTQPSSPSGAPTELLAENITMTEVTLTWNGVDCSARNSKISFYTIHYRPINEQTMVSVTVDGSEEEGGEVTVTGLHSSTNYSFQVAAVNEAGEMGPLSSPIYVETLTCNCRVSARLSARDVTLVSVLSTFVGTVLLHTGILIAIIAVFFRKIKKFLNGGSKANVHDQYSAVLPRKWRRNHFKRGPAEPPNTIQLENFEPALDPEESYANFEQIKQYRASIVSDFQPPQ